MIAFYASWASLSSGYHTPPPVMTDNGSCYKSWPSARPASFGLKHIRTKPYSKTTEGRALHPDFLREWAYAQAYITADEPQSCLSGYTDTTGTDLMPVSVLKPSHQQTRSVRGQPVEAPHLVIESTYPRWSLACEKTGRALKIRCWTQSDAWPHFSPIGPFLARLFAAKC